MSSYPLSLIVCTRNRARSLKRTLLSLHAAHPASVGAQVIVVDNGSTDSTPAVIREFVAAARFQVDAVHESEPGQGRARNRGLALAAGRILFFTDDDCILPPDILVLAIDAFANSQFDLCGGRIQLHDPTDSPYGCNDEDRQILIPPQSFLECGTVQGTCLLFSARLMRAVGGFDPMFGPGTPWRVDDIDYCQRASWAGFTIAHEPRLKVYHAHGRKPGADINQLDALNQYARGAYLLKHALLGSADHRRALAATLTDGNVVRSKHTAAGASAYMSAISAGMAAR
jgi:glycosyltransferase involved in cell wall biosynthesis